MLLQNKKFQALLGNFTSTQILHNVTQFPDRINAFEVDRAGLKKLCDTFIAYCNTKTKDDSYISGASYDGDDLKENNSNEWSKTQDWVSIV